MSIRSALAVVVLGVGFALVSAADSPPSPTLVTFKRSESTLGDVVAAVPRGAGLSIAVDTAIARRMVTTRFDKTPLWTALETAAHAADARILVEDHGRKIVLAPRGESREVACVSGPFRVCVRSVTGRLLLDAGAAIHTVQLDVHWEPRYPVYRIDSNPRLRAAKYDKSSDLIADSGVTRHHPTGAATEMTIRLAGLPRRALKIDVLAGEFRATMAEKMLTFSFDDLTGPTMIAKPQDLVTAKAKPFVFDETTKTWEVELELEYPRGGPTFESFEEHKWLRDNRLQLMSPQGKTVNPDSEDVTASSNKVLATYRFKGIPNPKMKGWALVYEAPGPLSEVTVPFKLENIPLP